MQCQVQDYQLGKCANLSLKWEAFVYVSTWKTTRRELIPADISVANRGGVKSRGRKIVERSSSCQICESVWGLPCFWVFFFPRGARLPVCSSVRLKLINLACFRLCIILPGVDMRVEPRAHSGTAVPPSVKVNTLATSVSTVRRIVNKGTQTWNKKGTEKTKETKPTKEHCVTGLDNKALFFPSSEKLFHFSLRETLDDLSLKTMIC